MNYFLIPHSLWPAPFRGWALLDCGLFFFQPIFLLFFAVLHFLLHYSVISIVVLFDPSLLGLFGLAVYPSPNDSDGHWSYSYMACRLLCPIFLLSILGSFVFLGHPWPIYFSWAFLAFILILLFHALLLTPLAFPAQLPYPSSLGLMDFPLTLYFLCLHHFGPVVAHSCFSTFAHGFASSLSLGSFRLICFLRAQFAGP